MMNTCYPRRHPWQWPGGLTLRLAVILSFWVGSVLDGEALAVQVVDAAGIQAQPWSPHNHRGIGPVGPASPRTLPPLPSVEAYQRPHSAATMQSNPTDLGTIDYGGVNYGGVDYGVLDNSGVDYGGVDYGGPNVGGDPNFASRQTHDPSVNYRAGDHALGYGETYGDPVYAGEAMGIGGGALFPNRPYLVPRVADRLRWRPLFPSRPHLLGSWPGGPALEQPRSFWLNPFSVQQGLGNFLFRGNQPADTGSLGFPFSLVPSHVVDRVPRPYLGHGQDYVQARHINRGQPLQGTSWTNRPYSVDVFTGAFLASGLTENIGQGNGMVTGFRVGWDFDHYWGSEFRLGFANTRLDSRPDNVDIRLGDISVLYYPWGDSRWRPYTSVGLGIGSFEFLDENFRAIDDYALQVPIAIGVKYAFRPSWGLRLDATNYLSMPSNDLEFMNNVALTGAIELRFGGRRRSYFPYSPSIHIK